MKQRDTLIGNDESAVQLGSRTGGHMVWWHSLLLGAGGGALVEVLAIFQSVAQWGADRRTKTGRVKTSPPSLREYVDLPVHAWLVPLRGGLGGGTAVLFVTTGQISGTVAAVALGYAAPTVLAQLGQFPQVKALFGGGATEDVARTTTEAVGSATIDSVRSEEGQQ